MRRFVHRLSEDERGAAIAEFMLGLIPLVIAFALIFEFGRAFWSHQAVIKGVRDATRYLTRVEDPNDPAAQAMAERLMLTGQQASGGTPRWSSGSEPPLEVQVDSVNNPIDPNTGERTFRGGATIQIVNVRANVELAVPLGQVFALFGGPGVGTITYSVGDTGRHYGQ